MAIKIPQSFNLTGEQLPVDSRLVLYKADMLETADPGSALSFSLPDPYFAVCIEDAKFYIYSRSFELSDETGYFKEYKADGTTVFVDGKSIKIDEENIISLNGYEEATEGKMPVKSADGLDWVTPVSTETLDVAVAAANKFAQQAIGQAKSAEIQANIAKKQAQYVENKIWFGTIDEYNDLDDIYADSIYIIKDGVLNLNE